ncbi:transglutaminase-like cysteine peptidase [Kordiimonas aestuarii]|uniref:transglutaminase-like cysteine peptidase n=1 Tax=Kordiimonas aestuarii TaxID=1005925 RepID=UPI0021D3DB3E|nr:transglutaminase-like cysteine peptidase [Kordiimonas aestuarii]
MRRLTCLILILASFVLLPSLGDVQAQISRGLFGSMEIRSTNMTKFGKWTEMWRRYNLPRNPPSEVKRTAQDRCRGLGRIQCSREAWDDFIAANTDTQKRILLDKVNAYMNKAAYIVDPVNWGIPDYWATPDEFFLKDGDCEDYAISKYITLKRLGFDPDSMRLVILQDENLNVAHAVLAVTLGDDTFILDNQIDAVLPDSQILHYRPVYSINESAWWLHRVRKFSG